MNLTEDINISGELLTVSADLVLEDTDGALHIVNLKRSAPKLSYAGRRYDSIPKNNIELYALKKLGEKKYSNTTIFGSFHHMEGKNDKNKKGEEQPFDAKKGYNIINCSFDNETDIKEAIEILIKKAKGNDFFKVVDKEPCRNCSFENICNYTKPTKVKLEKIKEETKAPENFSLTKSQRRAVLLDKGVSRINAGAGSGKTTVVALRVCELILDGCEPKDILMTTFTNKGAQEMRDKVKYWLGKEGVKLEDDELTITTFNAWGDDIIRDNYKALGFKTEPHLVEKVQKYDILFEILGNNPRIESFDYKNPVMNFRYAQGAVAKLNKIFDFMKANNVTTEEGLMSQVKDTADAKQILNMYKEYSSMLKERGLIEYQDQINMVMQLMEEDSPILKQYDYKHIITDEFQDTDSVQIDLIMYLANQPRFESLMVVGDDSQCQPAGTKVKKPDGSTVNIEDIEVGEKVLSCTVSRGYYPKSEEGTKSVTEISTHTVNNLISIETENGKTSEYTSNHRCFARIHLEGNEDKSVVYIMENEKGHFRVGQTQLFVKGDSNFGLRARMNAEGGKRAWILKVCDANDAWMAEQVCAYKFGIPQTTWLTRNTKNVTDELLDEMYDTIGLIALREKAIKCLEYFSRDINYPIFETGINKHFSKHHITEVRACNLMPEIMDVAVPKLKGRRWRNDYEQITSIKNMYYKEGIVVYGLNVEDYHTYVADDILTHNSIFGFRNTSQENILNFHKLFNEVKDIQIVENFRSTPEIVGLANHINSLNKNKIEKELISGKKSGSKPKIVAFPDTETEHREIAKKIKSLVDKGFHEEDIAVIGRTKYELFSIQKELEELNIPYILDIPEPLLNNIRIHMAKNLAEFIGDTEVTQGLYEYLMILTGNFENMSQKDIEFLINEEKEKVESRLEENTVEDEDLLEKTKRDILFEMIKNIEDKELKTFIKDVEERDLTFLETKIYLRKFVEYEDPKTIDKDNTKYRAVTLTTAHTSKGKEFNIVFNTVSKYLPDRIESAIEEERRLLFVSITRAKDMLYLTYTESKKNNFSKKYNYFPEELKSTDKTIKSVSL